MIAILLVLQIMLGSFLLNNLINVFKQYLSVYVSQKLSSKCTNDLYLYLNEEDNHDCPVPVSDAWPRKKFYNNIAQSFCVFTNIIQKSYDVKIIIKDKEKIFSCAYQ